MPPPDSDAFLKHLRATFRVEADDHMRAMAALLRELEQPVSAERRKQVVETLFREAHSLKGAARSVNLFDIEAACGDLETRLAKLKRGEAALTPAVVEALALSTDELERLLAVAAGEVDRGRRRAARGVTAPEAAVATAAPVAAATSGFPEPMAEIGETIRVPAARLSALLVQTEELLALKFGAGRLAAELRAASAEFTQWKKAWSRSASEICTRRRERDKSALRDGTRVGNRRQTGDALLSIDSVLDAVERDELFVKALSDRMERLRCLAEQEQRTLGGVAEKLQDDVKQVLMQPFGALLELLPRLVRDLARDSGKQAELRIDGEAIEIDRRILEQMKDPLIHLVRNAVDHGIETPAERVRRGKAERGRIRVTVTAKEGNQVELLIADDGAGIDVGKVTAAAIGLGLVAPADAEGLAAGDALALVYASGLSTREILSDISGRGLGLAIVREKIDKLGGSIALESPAGGGTTFRIVLPTSLANFHGLLVAVGDDQFVLPARNVERVVRIVPDAIGTAANREAIELGGEVLALVRLSEVLGLRPLAPRGETRHLVAAIVANGGKRIAFVVDAVLGDQEVLVKGLGPQLRRVRHIGGATVLGAGRLVPILNVPDLMTSAQRLGARSGAVPSATAPPKAARQSLLVVEDSVTSRTLLKNILESAGYDVATAVDGVDALTALRTGRFDLVVSDVEMPRMDGFDLTTRIRQDRKLADLPVVLVTALGSREHRERGVDVGANAYVVKSSFDQSNLLEVIRRLT